MHLVLYFGGAAAGFALGWFTGRLLPVLGVSPRAARGLRAGVILAAALAVLLLNQSPLILVIALALSLGLGAAARPRRRARRR